MRWPKERVEIRGGGEEVSRKNERNGKLLLTEAQKMVARDAPTAVVSVFTLTGWSRSCKQSREAAIRKQA